MLCSICNTTKETYEHLWNCPLNTNNIDFILSLLATEVLKDLNLNNISLIQQLESFLYLNNNPLLLADLAQGFIIKEFVKKINKFFQDITISTKFILKLWQLLLDYFRQYI